MEQEKFTDCASWYDRNRADFDQFCNEIENIIKRVLKAERITVQSISARVKDKKSFIEKCKKEKYTNPQTEIMDIVGIRIIAYITSDVRRICDVIEREFQIDIANSINKADVMEENQVGYLSVHYIAKLNDARAALREYAQFKNHVCEIQIRTLLQHAWAEIEHDRSYKFSGVLPKEIKRRFYLTAGILEMVDKEFQDISDDIKKYSDQVKEMTNKGELDIDINSTSLFEYMSRKFKSENIRQSFSGDDIMIIKRLKLFGISKLSALDKIVPYDFLEAYKVFQDQHPTFTGVIIDLMVINDYKKYCKIIAGTGILLDDPTQELYRHYNLPIKEIRRLAD